jgi:threonine/homoserine/homoserine lactone efflux protein
MNLLLLNITLGFVVSLLGSLPLGVLNLTALRLTVQQGIRAASRFVLACTLIEFVYAYLTVWGARWVSQYALLKPLAEGLTALVLLALGIHYLLKKPAESTAPVADAVGPFRLGVQLSLLNVAAFPFWTFYTTVLTHQKWVSLNTQPQLLIYVLGISAGTLAGLWVFVWGGQWLLHRFTHRLHQLDRLMGWLLVGLGLMQVVSTWVF